MLQLLALLTCGRDLGGQGPLLGVVPCAGKRALLSVLEWSALFRGPSHRASLHCT